MASPKAQKIQSDAIANAPIEFTLGKKTYKIKRLSNWVALQMSKFIIEADLSRSEDGKNMMVSIEKNRTLVPKCISLMILKSTWKVKLFHWFKWRQLHYLYSQEDYSVFVDKVLNDEESMFFFQNMASFQSNNILTAEMTQASTKNIAQKHSSAQSMIK